MKPARLSEGETLPAWEGVVYAALVDAAERGAVCPLNLDLEMLIGCSSCSTAPRVVARLERRGLIYVERFQRFRRVKIVATGKWTARDPSQHGFATHVPRGTVSRGPVPTERKVYRNSG